MPAGRHPLPPAVAHGPDFVTATPADMAEQEALARDRVRSNAPTPVAALAKTLAYDGALTVESLEEEIKFYQRRSVEAVLEMGKRLLLLKEIAGHGGFADRLEGLSISHQMANKFMSATLKFSNSSSTSILGLPNLNQTKLLELLTLDDGEIAALNSGDMIRGIVLDDVDCMSVSELRRALRLAKADQDTRIAAKDRLLADKQLKIDNQNKALDELGRKARFVAVASPSEKYDGIRMELLAHAAGIEGALAGKLRPSFAALKEHMATHGGECDAYLSSALGQIERAVREIREDFGLLRAEDVAPWATEE